MQGGSWQRLTRGSHRLKGAQKLGCSPPLPHDVITFENAALRVLQTRWSQDTQLSYLLSMLW
jgi:hypothetical protein